MVNGNVQKLIVNLACTGIVPTRSANLHVPINHGEIVDDVAACMELGVQMFHLHARDREGLPTSDPEPYGRMIEEIRKLPGGRDVVLCVSTSGRVQPDFESRTRVLELDGDMKPDMASLTPGSLNFIESSSVNAPDMIRRLVVKMKQFDIIPELEIFDAGMAHFVQVLVREGVLNSPLYINVLFGNIFSVQPTATDVAAVLANLPSERLVSFAGIGRFQLTANVLGLIYADGVRVGLEDNLWYDTKRSVSADNCRLVRRILRLADELERPLMTSKDVRSLLALVCGGN